MKKLQGILFVFILLFSFSTSSFAAAVSYNVCNGVTTLNVSFGDVVTLTNTQVCGSGNATGYNNVGTSQFGGGPAFDLIVTISKIGSGSALWGGNAVTITSTAIAPAAPTVNSITPGNGTLAVSATLGSNGGSAVTGVDYSTDNGGSWAATGGTSGTFTINGLTNGTTYQVRVRANNAAGNGTQSAATAGTPVASAPAASTINAITPGNGTLAVVATLGANGGSAITGVDYSTNNGGSWTATGGTSGTFTINGLTNGTTYQVRVRANNAVGNGTQSAATAGTPVAAPAAPTINSITPGNGSLAVVATLGANGGSAVTGVDYSTDNGGSWTATGGTSGTFTINGLINGTTYQVRVRANNAAGNGTQSAATAGTPATTSGAPTINSITPGNGSLAVVATLGANGGLAITGVDYSTDNGGSWTATGGTSGTFAISGLSNGTVYQVRVRANNAIGNGTQSAAMAGTPASPLASIVSISPSQGDVAGGTSVAIAGLNFVGVTAVRFGSMNAKGFTVNSATSITAISPASAAGMVDITVVTASSTSAVSAVGQFTYVARANPAADISVRKQVSAQVATGLRFARIQVDNVWGHIQQLHAGFDLRSNRLQLGFAGSNAAGVNALVDKLASTYGSVGRNEAGATQAGVAPNNLLRVSEKTPCDGNIFSTSATMIACSAGASGGGTSESGGSGAKTALNNMLFGDLPVALWSTGAVETGSFSGNDFSTAGLTFGMDFQLRRNVILGASVGYGNDKTTIDGLGSTTKSRQVSATVYGSYQPANDWFVDAIIGYGKLVQDNNRWAAGNSTIVSGQRRGSSWYGTLAFSNVFNIQKIKFEPYIRGDAVSLRLDSYAEQGLALAALSYDRTVVNAQALSAGITASYEMPFAGGVLIPSSKFQYTRNRNGNINQNVYYTDIGAGGGYYSMGVTSAPEDMFKVGVGLAYQRKDGLTINLGYVGSTGSSQYRANALKLDIGVAF